MCCFVQFFCCFRVDNKDRSRSVALKEAEKVEDHEKYLYELDSS